MANLAKKNGGASGGAVSALDATVEAPPAAMANGVAVVQDGKKNAAISVEQDLADLSVLVKFANGKKFEIGVEGLTQGIRDRLMLHGLEQKLRDAAAAPKGTPLVERIEAVENVRDNLLNGDWSAKREGGEPTGGLLLTALCRVYPDKEREKLKEYLGKKTKAEQAKLRGTARIMEEIAKIHAERAGSEDVENLLAEVDAI